MCIECFCKYVCWKPVTHNVVYLTIPLCCTPPVHFQHMVCLCFCHMHGEGSLPMHVSHPFVYCNARTRVWPHYVSESARPHVVFSPHNPSFPFTSGFPLSLLASLCVAPWRHQAPHHVPFCPKSSLGCFFRETKPTGCEVHLHGLCLLLPKAVLITAGPLSPCGVQLLASQPHFHLSDR